MNYQNLHLADKSLFTQYRTLFPTSISDAHSILSNSQLTKKSFLNTDYNNLSDSLETLETAFIEAIPDFINEYYLDYFDTKVSNIKDKGSFMYSRLYHTFNIVRYTSDGETSLYFQSSTSDVSHTYPSLGAPWVRLGLQGEKGYPTIGSLVYKDKWSPSESYSVNDVVEYEDSSNNSEAYLFVLKTASPGTTPPPSNSKWGLLVELDRRKINFSTTNLQDGDIYWQELT